MGKLDYMVKGLQKEGFIKRISTPKDKKVKLERFKEIQKQLEKDLKELKKEIEQHPIYKKNISTEEAVTIFTIAMMAEVKCEELLEDSGVLYYAIQKVTGEEEKIATRMNIYIKFRNWFVEDELDELVMRFFKSKAQTQKLKSKRRF